MNNEWIRENNLIEGIDNRSEDQRGEKIWNVLIDEPFDLNTILELHRSIMCVLNPQIAGTLRHCNVQVGKA